MTEIPNPQNIEIDQDDTEYGYPIPKNTPCSNGHIAEIKDISNHSNITLDYSKGMCEDLDDP